jgi:hypothetical protein
MLYSIGAISVDSTQSIRAPRRDWKSEEETIAASKREAAQRTCIAYRLNFLYLASLRIAIACFNFTPELMTKAWNLHILLSFA